MLKFGAIFLVAAVVSVSIARGASLSSGYEARFSIAVPFNGNGLSKADTNFSFSAGTGSLKRLGPQHAGRYMRYYNKFAVMRFSNDGTVEKMRFGIDANLNQHRTDDVRPGNHTVRILPASSTRRPVNVRYSQRRAGVGARCKSVVEGAIRNRRQLVNLRVRQAYCRAMRAHRAMKQAYRIYQSKTRISANAGVMPELDGGPKQHRRGSKARHAYFDYSSAREAYMKSLNEYRAIQRAARHAIR